MAKRLPAPPHPEWLRPQKRSFAQKIGGKRRVTQPALMSAFIVKEDGRAVNRVRSICAKNLHKVAHSGEQRRMKPKKEEGRICKMSVYDAHDL